jgi:hypothetical protein
VIVITLCLFAECLTSDCHYADCLIVECLFAECHYAECLISKCLYAECLIGKCNYAYCPAAEFLIGECHYGECLIPEFGHACRDAECLVQNVATHAVMLSLLMPWLLAYSQILGKAE